MNKKYYTPNGSHPEDEIFRVAEFLKELTKVQEDKFKQLAVDLQLTATGEEWLFDYIYNSFPEDGLSFDEYLAKYKLSYKDCVDCKECDWVELEKNVERWGAWRSKIQ